MARQGIADGAYMGRSGAAAAADDPDPQFQHPLVIGSHLLGCAREYRFSVLETGEPRIGLGYERQPGHTPHLGKDPIYAVHAETTVGTDYIGPHRLQGYGRGLRRSAENTPPVVVKGHHGDYRDIPGNLANGDDGASRLFDVEEGFEGYQVSAGLDERDRLFPEDQPHLIERAIPDTFDEPPGGTDGSRHIGILASHFTGYGH